LGPASRAGGSQTSCGSCPENPTIVNRRLSEEESIAGGRFQTGGFLESLFGPEKEEKKKKPIGRKHLQKKKEKMASLTTCPVEVNRKGESSVQVEGGKKNSISAMDAAKRESKWRGGGERKDVLQSPFALLGKKKRTLPKYS